jgi:uroporphyrinogen-III synthase
MTPPSTILVIRAKDSFSAVLTGLGLNVINLPLIDTPTFYDADHMAACLEGLDEYDGVFLTSPVAANVLLSLGSEQAKRYNGTYWVVGQRTREMLQNVGIRQLATKADSVSELFAQHPVEEFAGKRFLFLRGDKSLNLINETLKPVATVDQVVVYRTVEHLPDPADSVALDQRFASGEIEWVCFFSPSAVDAFGKIPIRASTGTIKAAAIGQTTAKAARDKGYDVAYVSRSASAEEFAAGLASTINGN